MNTTTPIVFDGHNDLLLHLYNGLTPEDARDGTERGHIDLPRAHRGGFGGGLFAIFVPGAQNNADRRSTMENPPYDVPLPPMLEQSEALSVAIDQFAAFRRLETLGVITPCTTVAEIRATLGSERLAAVLHMEGAEAIDPDLEALELFHAAGLRSLGPVWSRPTRFGHGVPFRYPSTGDIGPGLTDAGKRLVKACNRLRIMLDVSHLNAAGFDDLAALTDAPLVASHSNAHAICPHARNLTDSQLDRIAETNGLVGINFAAAFLRPDGRMDPDVGLDILMRHLDHLVARLGEDGVGFGSDFNGAKVPRELADCAGLPRLCEALRRHGVDDVLQQKLCHGNWLRVLERTWGA